MIIDFDISNHRCFKGAYVDAFTQAASGESKEVSGAKPLPAVGFFGADGVGKTTLFDALNSCIKYATSDLCVPPYAPDVLDPAFANKPTLFRIRFLDSATQTVYSYKIEFTRKLVSDESLCAGKMEDEELTPVFERDASGKVRLHEAALETGESAEASTPYLAKCRAISPSDGAYRAANVLAETLMPSWSNNNELRDEAAESEARKKAAEFVKHLNPSIREIKLMRGGEPRAFVLNAAGRPVALQPWGKLDGMGKLYEAALLVSRALAAGKTLLYDDFGDGFHPFAAEALLRLFGNKKANDKGAQLIFSTNVPFLMKKHFLEKEQIFFIERDCGQSASAAAKSVVYSLQDFDFDFGAARDYHEVYCDGRLGAFPQYDWETVVSLFGDDQKD